MSALVEGYRLETDPTRFDFALMHSVLSNSYWAGGLTRERMDRAVDHSLCVAAFHGGTQVGFARVVSDRAHFAWIADVFVLPEHSGKGIARASAPGAAIIHFFGGIHEIYFPYVLMNPRLLLAVILGGMTGVHQFVHIGAHSFCGGGSIVLKDVPPYLMVHGAPCVPAGINTEGLKRRGFSSEALLEIRRAYKEVYRKGQTVAEALAALEEKAASLPELKLFTDFIANASRGIVR